MVKSLLSSPRAQRARDEHRVVAPFPVTLEGGAAHVKAQKGLRYQILIDGQTVEVGSLSSYYKALEIANLLADEIRRGGFRLAAPIARLCKDAKMKPLVKREPPR